MRPAHGNFRGAQTVMAREIQQLWIEPKAFNALLLKNDAAGVAAEGLESALSIHKGEPQNSTHDEVE